MLQVESGFNAHFEWPENFPDNECLMTLTCFDDYPYAPLRKDRDDLESYIVRKFGSMIVEGRRKPSKLELSSASKGIPLSHPILKQDKKDYPSFQDNFREEYLLPLTKEQLLEANSTLNEKSATKIKVDNIKKRSGYESDIYNLRVGVWR